MPFQMRSGDTMPAIRLRAKPIKRNGATRKPPRITLERSVTHRVNVTRCAHAV